MFYEKPNSFYMGYPFELIWDQEQMQEREARLIKSFYPQIALKVQAVVERECDRLEYDGSMLYDEYPDRFMLEQICHRVEERVKAEALTEQEKENPWLGKLVSVLFCNELYRRRCRRRRCRRYF